MCNNWIEITLGNILHFSSGGTPSKENSKYWNGLIPWVSAKDMKKFYLDDTEDHVTHEGLNNGTKLVLEKTVFLLIRGMTLLNDVPICVARCPMTFNQDIKALRPKDGICEEFIPYLLLGNKQRLLSLVDLAGHGTGRLNTDELKNLDISLPPLPEQRAIADILSSLDDKIELNNRMNKTLEQMARAIFNRWFVEFEFPPLIGSGLNPTLSEGGYKSSGGVMIDSELGGSTGSPTVIPEGWEVKNIQDVLSLSYGKSLKAETRIAGTIPVYGSNGIVGYHNEFLVKGPGIVVGRKGNPGTVTWVHSDFFPIDTTFYIEPQSEEYSLYYLFYVLKNQNLPDLSADSAVPGLSRNIVYMNKIIIPKRDVIISFENLIKPLFEKINENTLESRTLSSLRDTLLPRLMSGELRVPPEKIRDYEHTDASSNVPPTGVRGE